MLGTRHPLLRVFTIMNDHKLIETASLNPGTEEMDLNFISIDDPKLKWPCFVLAMLRVGRILTAKESVAREVTAQRVSRVMQRHHTNMPYVYQPKEIRENFKYYGSYLCGGGIQIEWYELPEERDGSPIWYHFTFSRIYRREELVVNSQEHYEPAGT